MFGKFRRGGPSKYDAPIEKALASMETYDTDDAEFADALNFLERLTKLKEAEKPNVRKVSPDTLALVLGNLAGILVIVAYEQKHVMTSVAKGFILKVK